MPVPRKTLLLYSFFFCRLTAGGCDVFLSCLRRGGEGVASSMRHVRRLVWLSVLFLLLLLLPSSSSSFLLFFVVVVVVVVVFAWWSTPKETLFILSFHLLLGPGYRVSPASHTKCCFSRYLVPATLCFTCPTETFTGKNKKQKQKHVSRLILSYATLWLRLGHHRNTDAHRETDLLNQQTS